MSIQWHETTEQPHVNPLDLVEEIVVRMIYSKDVSTGANALRLIFFSAVEVLKTRVTAYPRPRWILT